MKLQIRHDYLNNLETMYRGRVDYSSGSRPRELAIKAADAALAGSIKLEGDAWEKAVRGVTGWTRWTKAMIAALPE